MVIRIYFDHMSCSELHWLSFLFRKVTCNIPFTLTTGWKNQSVLHHNTGFWILIFFSCRWGSSLPLCTSLRGTSFPHWHDPRKTFENEKVFSVETCVCVPHLIMVSFVWFPVCQRMTSYICHAKLQNCSVLMVWIISWGLNFQPSLCVSLIILLRLTLLYIWLSFV